MKLNKSFLIAVLASVFIFILAWTILNPDETAIFVGIHNKALKYEDKYDDDWKSKNRSLTVVTAYIDLGNFPKGSTSTIRTSNSYWSWMQAYKYLTNPLIIYTDSEKFAEYCTRLRANMSSKTKVIIFSKEQLWSFKIKHEIAKIYSKTEYPKVYPNTYLPEYTSMTHSKLPLVVKAIESNYFITDYYCWIDLGYFRDIVQRACLFYLEVPNDFDDKMIGVTRVFDSNLENLSARSIILGTKNWIAGGLFLGKPKVLKAFEEQYKHRVFYYMSQGLMNAEQHILYAMYTCDERKKNPIDIEVQLYIPGTKKVINKNPWFYLGFVMYHEV